ncbi:MAG: hypothetical protein ACR9NN_23935 [Nostochopsis sp.]
MYKCFHSLHGYTYIGSQGWILYSAWVLSSFSTFAPGEVQINTSPNKVDLTTWAIVNQLKQKVSLDGFTIEPGGVVRVPLSGKDMQLSNKGGTLSLLNQEGIKADGVSYTKKDTQEQGWTTVF